MGEAATMIDPYALTRAEDVNSESGFTTSDFASLEMKGTDTRITGKKGRVLYSTNDVPE